ncbi:hypothetical protein HMPREF9004_0243 [Schaalia cardiffensis F0333]|uniref:Uncharacterized protein n=1 Tax=Schaalia cardiffensis F0333 TaxID=888050 RepID=N6XCF2_9ACTO|nr:hypothetical protein HMPREF9004_0243 [Schaalia cardiffensis F0333]
MNCSEARCTGQRPHILVSSAPSGTSRTITPIACSPRIDAPLA